MLKKALLSTLFAISTIATAQINLDLNLTITSEQQENHSTGSVVVDNDATASIVFNGLDVLIVNIYTKVIDNNANFHVQFFQRMETDELIPVSELFNVQVPLNEQATVTVYNPDNDDSLILGITPSLTE